MNSRAKGASFELLVARMILEATGLDKSHCYRTPLSGGHAQYRVEQPGDLFISDTLYEWFPYVVEAKHNRTWHPGVMLCPRKQERDWLDQVSRDTKNGRLGASPLLVMRGNGTEIFAAMPRPAYRRSATKTESYIVFRYKGNPWVMAKFSDVLNTSLPKLNQE